MRSALSSALRTNDKEKGLGPLDESNLHVGFRRVSRQVQKMSSFHWPSKVVVRHAWQRTRNILSIEHEFLCAVVMIRYPLLLSIYGNQHSRGEFHIRHQSTGYRPGTAEAPHKLSLLIPYLILSDAS